MTTTQPDLAHLLTLAVDAVGAGARLALDPGEALAVETKTDRNDVVTQVDRAVENLIAERLLGATGYPLLGEEGHSLPGEGGHSLPGVGGPAGVGGGDSVSESGSDGAVRGPWAGRLWVLDPIDGTMNYVVTRRDWAISLALCEDGEPVLAVVADPVAGHVYTALAGRGALWDGRPMARVDGGCPGRPDGGASFRDGVVIAGHKEVVALPRLSGVVEESRGLRRYGAAALEMVEVAAGRAGAFVHLWLAPWDVAAAVLICRECGVRVTRLDGTRMDVREKGSALVAAPRAHGELLARLVIDAV